MKKFLILLILLFGFSCFTPAEAVQEPTGITFIYINGSNNLSYKNRDKFRIAFIEDVKKYLCPSKNKLSIAASEYGFNEVNYHNALVDCYATLHLMKTIENIERITTK